MCCVDLAFLALHRCGGAEDRQDASQAVDREAFTARVENAGLVLLWPFLPDLFQRLDLLRGGGFSSEEHQLRAVLLTQYLVTGGAEAPEHWEFIKYNLQL